MWSLLSSTLPEGGRFATLGEAAIYALIGFAVVFLGISLLVFIVWGLGQAFEKIPKALKKKEQPKPAQELQQESVATAEIDDETVAVIMAAITAFYQKEQIPCEFVIKKIKRN